MKKRRRYLKLFKIISPEYTVGMAGIVFIVFLFVFGKFFYRPPLPKLTPLSEIPRAFIDLSLDARAVYVYDAAEKRQIYSRNGGAQLPLASLTKIMMALTALSLLPENAPVTINADSLKLEGDGGLYGNERWRLKDLLDLTLLESSNDGADAIASVSGGTGQGGATYDSARLHFVAEMNRKAVEFGLNQTYFLNPTGLDESGSTSGGYGSARDIAVLFSEAVTKYPELFGVTRYGDQQFTSLSGLKHSVKNTNTYVGTIPSLLGSKTGYTDLAGGNLVVAFDAGPNHPIVISVLGSTEKGRFDDVEKLVWTTLEYLKTDKG